MIKNNRQIIKSLRAKDSFYLKIDKDIKIVILDKQDFFDRTAYLITNDY